MRRQPGSPCMALALRCGRSCDRSPLQRGLGPRDTWSNDHRSRHGGHAAIRSRAVAWTALPSSDFDILSRMTCSQLRLAWRLQPVSQASGWRQASGDRAPKRLRIDRTSAARDQGDDRAGPPSPRPDPHATPATRHHRPALGGIRLLRRSRGTGQSQPFDRDANRPACASKIKRDGCCRSCVEPTDQALPANAARGGFRP